MRQPLFFLLLLGVKSIFSQTHTVADTVTGNVTRYQLLKDSTYRFVSTFNGRVISEGKIIAPNLNEHVKNIYRVNHWLTDRTNPNDISNYSDYKLTDTCREYGLNGKQLIELIVIPNQSLTINFFHEGYLNRSCINRPDGATSRSFDQNGNLINEEIYLKNQSRTFIQYKDGQVIKNEFIYDKLTSEYKPIGNYHKKLRADGKSYDYEQLDDKTQLLVAKGAYVFDLGLKFDQTFKYNENKKCIENTRQLYNEKTKIQTQITVINQYDKKGRLISSTKRCIHPQLELSDSENYTFNYNADKGFLRYRLNNREHSFKISDKGLDIVISGFDGDRLVIKARSDEVHTTLYKNGRKNKSRHRLNTDFNFTERYNDTGDVSDFVKSLFQDDELNNQDQYLNSTFFQTEIDRYFTKQQEIHFVDTFFDKNGKDSMTSKHHNDTTIIYKRINGQYQLEFHSHYLRIVKDFHLCAVGLKNNEHQWVIQAKYTSISFNPEEDENLYYCRNGQFTDIYNWKGEMIGQKLEHLIFIDHYRDSDEPYMSIPKRIRIQFDSLPDVQVLLIAENDTLGVHKLIQTNGKTVCDFPFKFNTLNGFSYITEKDLYFICTNENGKTAIFNLNAQLTEYEFDRITPFTNNSYLTSKNNEMYIVAEDFKTKLSENFIEMIKLNDTVVLLKHDDERLTLFNLNLKTNFKTDNAYRIADEKPIKDHLYITNKDGNLFGLMNFELTIKIKPEYTQILINDSGFICKKNGQYDFYDCNGKLRKSIELDSILNLNYNFGNDNFYNHKRNLLFTQKGNQYGLINKTLETVIEPQYSNILECEKFYMFCRQEDTLFVSFDHQIIDHVFPQNQYIYFKDLVTQNIGLLNSKGHLIAYPIIPMNGAYKDRFTLTAVVQKQPLYLVDIEGNIKIDLRSFSEIRDKGQYYYVKDHSGLAGIMDKNGRIKVKPEHQLLAYDEQNEVIWFNSKPLSYQDNGYLDVRPIWKIKSLKTGKISEGTFERPTKFIAEKCALKNHQKKLGAIDSKLNILIPFEYSEMIGLYPYIGFKKQETILITDTNYHPLKKLNLNFIGRAENHFWGYYKGRSILYDSNFNAIDSSSNNFSNSKRKLPIDLSYRIASTLSNKTIYNSTLKNNQLFEDNYSETTEDEYLEEFYNESENVPDSIGTRKINNTLATIYYYSNISQLDDQYKVLSRFPEVYSNSELDEMYEFNENDQQLIELKSTLKHSVTKTYKPLFKRIDQIPGSPIHVTCYTDNFISFQSPEAVINHDLYFNNFYIDDVFGFAYIDLYDLIDPTKTIAFNKSMYEYLSQLEDPDVPCFPKTDYMKMFQNNFIITTNGLLFYLNDTNYKIKFEISDIKPFLRDYWKDKI